LSLSGWLGSIVYALSTGSSGSALFTKFWAFFTAIEVSILVISDIASVRVICGRLGGVIGNIHALFQKWAEISIPCTNAYPITKLEA
jgi:hypothetical protein